MVQPMHGYGLFTFCYIDAITTLTQVLYYLHKTILFVPGVFGFFINNIMNIIIMNVDFTYIEVCLCRSSTLCCELLTETYLNELLVLCYKKNA